MQQDLFIRIGLGSEALAHFTACHNANLSYKLQGCLGSLDTDAACPPRIGTEAAAALRQEPHESQIPARRRKSRRGWSSEIFEVQTAQCVKLIKSVEVGLGEHLHMNAKKNENLKCVVYKVCIFGAPINTRKAETLQARSPGRICQTGNVPGCRSRHPVQRTNFAKL